MNKRRLLLFSICIILALAAAIQPGYALNGSQNASDVVDTTGIEITNNPHDVSVMFTNVGYGDATLVQINGYSYLIDTGSKASVPQLLGALAMCGVKKLEAVFLTHTHSDHIGGMEALASQYAIGTLYSAEISEDKKNGENKIDLLAAELLLNHVKLTAGDAVSLSAEVYLDVLGPVVYNSEDDNDNSLVLRLGVNGRVFLFTGDMQFAEEGTLLAAGVDLRADVLKVGNHGNPDATSQMFAVAVSPKIAAISTSTMEDADSANERVISLFDGARVLVTEDFTRGALLYVSASGEIEISNPQPPSPGADIEIVEIDKNAQTITLINNGTEIDISGYMVFSQRGSEVYVFPQGTVIKASQVLTIACTGGDGDLIWNEKKVWHVKKDDAGVLYDSFGNELSRSQ